MKKTDKKIENTLRESLTEVCDVAQESVLGFKWLTHRVDYRQFPQSLKVICVFDSEDDRQQAVLAKDDVYMRMLIQDKLAKYGVKLNSLEKHVRFDSEEACLHEHNGRWVERLGR